ncbi:MAG: NAD(P)-binding protein, partial [Fusobacteria bacterium]|nr:NAD(P)-binding protein [Fusobacteriota bacterium]
MKAIIVGGGVAGLAAAIRLRAANYEVEEIVIENNQVQGIMVRETFIPADQVLCNADFPYGISELVKDKKTKGKYTEKKIKEMDYSCSGYLLYLGLYRKIENMEPHNVIFSKDFKGN